MVEMVMTYEVRLLSVEGTLGDFIVQTGKQLDDIITKLDELLAKLSFSIEALKEELELTNSKVALMKEDIAESSNKGGSISKAQTKLRRQTVKDLPFAIAAADALLDFKTTTSTTSPEKMQKERGRGTHHKSWSKCEVDRSDKGKEKATTSLSNIATSYARDRIGARSYQINNVEVFAMLDTRATNNFIATRVKTRLGLTVTKSDGRLKTVNAEAHPIEGATTTLLEFDSWRS
ncbi:unnamed protein product [Citrullus colocynthis]|uniref:Uncharacterized protein n=1 Tax=Citrullus colocynthis TaxID=252529 RepID=A0ABP0Y1V5_9ROSI